MRNVQSLKIPYGLLNGQLKHVSEVKRGLDCECVCASCGERLVAKKGNKTVHHFAHDAKTGCANATETAIHLAAKEILEECKTISLPDAFLKYIGNTLYVSEQATVELDAVEVEKSIGGFRADLVAYFKGVPLIIEIKVTHAVGVSKRKAIKKSGISAIEISLDKISRECTREELKHAVIDTVENKIWLYHRKLETLQTNIIRLCERIYVHSDVSENTGYLFTYIDYCPLQEGLWTSNKSKYFSDDNCWSCEYFYSDVHCSSEEEMEKYGHSPFAIMCLGKHEIKTYQDYKNVLENVTNAQKSGKFC